MPRIPEQKRPDIDWASMSDKIGDFLVDKIWGGPANEDYFKEKYGDEWRSNYDKTERNVRSLYGLLPAKNTSQAGLALEALSHIPAAAPIFGALIPLFRGQPAVRRNIAKLFRSGTKGWSGGDFPTEKSLSPSYWTMLKREASIYPLPPFRGKKDLWQIMMDEEDIRKYAQGMESFKKGGAITPYQIKQDRWGRWVPKRETQLHAVYEGDFPLEKVKTIGRWRDVEFPDDPYAYRQLSREWMEPRTTGWEDLTEFMREFTQYTGAGR